VGKTSSSYWNTGKGRSRDYYYLEKSRAKANTDATDWDTDGDGLPDGWIDGWGYNTTLKRWERSKIKNGLKDRGVLVNDFLLAEYEDKSLNGKLDANETDPLKPDTDGGGAWDGDEIISEPPRDPLNPLDDWDIADFDRDGLTDEFENNSLTGDPKNQTIWNNPDTDDDNLWDGFNIDIDYDGKIDHLGEKVGHNKYDPTYPNSSDSDNDGLNDGQEVNGDKGYLTDPNSNDTDGDGLTDGFDLLNSLGELSMHHPDQTDSTDPLKPDSDGDGLSDGYNKTIQEKFYLGELEYGTNPKDRDTDNDYLSDYEEITIWKTNPLVMDTDGGSVDDGTEVIFKGTDPNDPFDDIDIDTDLDLIYNHIENKTKYSYSTVDWDGIPGFDYYTNWKDNDTDNDGLIDGYEVLIKTNPLHNDTDNDTITDYDELNGIMGYVTNPLNPDTDGDGLTDILEITTYYTDPTLNDTDGGGIDDYTEIDRGSNPLDPDDDEKPPLPVFETQILLHTLPTNVTKGKVFSVKGNITTVTGEIIWPAIVTVKIYLSSNLTSAPLSLAGSGMVKEPDGEFRIDCIVPGTVSFGPNFIVGYATPTLTATKMFNESWSNNNPEQENSTVYVFSDTILRFINPTLKINKGARLEGSGNLTDRSSIPIAGVNVTILFDGSEVVTKLTDQNGIVLYQFQLNEDVKIGPHDIELYFEGNQYLTESSANYTITVRSDNTDINITLDKTRVVVNDFIWLNGTITGIDNESISSKMSVIFFYRTDDTKIEKFFRAYNGTFQVQIYLPAKEFGAGFYDVYVEFPGSDIYSEDTSQTEDILVIGLTSFLYPQLTVYRGMKVIYLPCQLIDNLGRGVGGRLVKINIKLDDEIGFEEITSPNGSFFIKFNITEKDPLGAIEIIFNYTAKEYDILESNISVANIFIKSPTKILIDEYPLSMVRTEGYWIKGRVLDDRDKNVSFEPVLISLGADESIKSHFSAITDKNGIFEVSVLVPLSFPLGVNPIEVTLGLSDKYETTQAINYTIVFSNPVININTNSTIKKGENYLLTIVMTEDNRKIPITLSIISLEIDGVHKAHLTTDNFGYAYYEAIFPTDRDQIIVTAKYNGSEIEYYRSTKNEILLKQESTEKEESNYFSAMNQFWILLIGCIVIIIIAFFWLRWRRQHIIEVSEVLTDFMKKLETSDKTRRIIYETYLKLLEILNKYGFIRKESETAREFEHAISEALPHVKRKNLDNLTSLFEEARYSDHKLHKSARVKAVKNLKIIRKSLVVQPA
jgi:hypothetical protein